MASTTHSGDMFLLHLNVLIIYDLLYFGGSFVVYVIKMLGRYFFYGGVVYYFKPLKNDRYAAAHISWEFTTIVFGLIRSWYLLLFNVTLLKFLTFLFSEQGSDVCRKKGVNCLHFFYFKYI